MADTVAVASSVYNLAGDEANRPNFLKSLILGGVIQEVDSLGRVISEGYRNGPGIRFRRFLQWAKNNPSFQSVVGVTQGTLQGIPDLNHNVIKNNIPVAAGEVVDQVETARIELGDISYWVLQYLAEAYPTGTEPYSYKYNKTAGEVVITFGSGVIETFPVEFFSAARYLYVRYLPANPEREVLPDMGEFATVASFPVLDGWYQTVNLATESILNLGFKQTTRVSYSDGRPEENSVNESTRPVTVSQYNNTYYQDSFKGKGPGSADSVYSERHWLDTELSYAVGGWVSAGPDIVRTQVLADGTVKTTRITRESQGLVTVRKSREGLGNVIHKTWLPPRYFIYRQGSGNATLDALFAEPSPSPMGDFFPPIPFRYDNKAITGKTNTWKMKMPPSFLVPTEGNPALQVGHQVYIGKSPEDWIDADGDNRFDYASCLVLEVDDGNGFTSVEGYDLPPENEEDPEFFTQRYRLKGILKNTPVPIINRGFDPQNCVELPEPSTTFQIPASEVEVEQYLLYKKAFKKAFNADFDEVQESILDNESIGNIDYVYSVFGVSFNVKENACRKYVYKFFQHLLNTTPNYTAAEEANWLASWQQAYDAEEAWKEWKNTENAGGPESSRYQEPQRLPFPKIPWQSLKVESVHDGVSDYRTDIKWAFIHEDIGSGLLKPGAKKGELWFEVFSNPLAQYREVDEENPDGFNQRVALSWQETETTWRRLTVTGLQHINYIYKDMKVVTTAKVALEPQTAGRESPFIVPLHETLYREMSMVDATQMATACCFLVFNCYEVDKEEWYETWWFKVIIIAAIVAISVAAALFTGGGSLGAGGGAILGLLGGVGITGTAAIILAAVANTLAGLLLSWLITEGSVAIFGEKWGALIGAVVSTVISLGLSAGSVAKALEFLSKPDGWFALGMATVNATASFLQASAQELAESTAKMMEAYSAKTAEVQRMMNELNGSKEIDPSLINKYVSEVTEKPENFLLRTLMTGSDIVDLTLSSIENFAEHRLRLEIP